MEPISQSLPAVTTSQKLTQQSPNSNVGKLKAARDAYRVIMRGRPEYGQESPEYTAGFIETLSHLTPEELAWVTDPRDGVHTRCKFLPTPADVFELIREKQAIREKINPRTSWQRLTPDAEIEDYEPDVERRKRIVKEALGYDPQDRKVARVVKPMTDEEIRDVFAKSKYRGAVLSDEARASAGIVE